MYKRIILISLMLSILGLSLKAQINTSSPYSRFGIGDIESHTLGRSSGMGSISTGMRLPFEINIVNPASYTAIPNGVFLFQVGTKVKRTDYSTVDQALTDYDFSFSSINAAFKVNNFWAMSFGMNPLSSLGYEINVSDSVTLNDNTSYFSNQYSGEGGITKLYLGNAFKYKGLSVGFNLSYLFGPITKKTTSSFSDEVYQSYVSDIETNNVKDIQLRYGIQYSDSIANNFHFTIGAFYENKTNINALSTKFTNRILSLGSDININDTIFNDTISSGNIQLPSSYGIGFSISTKQFLFGADYSVSNWKGVEFFGDVPQYFTNSSRISAGMDYTNDYTSKKYFKTVNFRLGGHYTKTNLILNSTQINDIGVSFGFGFPINLGTKINIAFEIGKKGTTENNLIQENYYLMNLNFNLTDRWFVRRKFF